MWHTFGEFLLKIRASNLGHDAVIEILVALLGVMIAVLTLIMGIFAATVAVLGIFGFQTIKDEAARRADLVATKVSKKTATETATEIAENVAYNTASMTATDVAKSIAESIATHIARETATAIGSEIIEKAIREREAVDIAVSQNLPDEIEMPGAVPSIQASGLPSDSPLSRESARESVKGDEDLMRGDK